MLLKAEEFEASPLSQQVFNLNDIAAEADQIIADAQRRSDEMLAGVSEQIAAEREKSRQEGHQTGRRQGLEEGREVGHQQAFEQAREEFAQSCENTCRSLANILSEFDQSKQRILWQAEQGTVTLALAIAEKVIKKTVASDRAVVVENTKAVLELISHATNVVVRANPKDLQYLNDMAGEDKGPLARYHSVAVEPDETISPGGCRVHTAQGSIDGTIETQIERIANELVMADIGAATDGDAPADDQDDQNLSQSQ